MARISENVIAGLANPSFSKGLFTAGQAIGASPQMMRQKRQEEEEAKMLSAIDRNTPEGLMQLATFYGGKPDMESKKLAMEYSGEARKLAKERAEQAALDRRKGQVQTMLTNYGMDALAEQVPNITDADELGDMVGAIQTHMLKNMPTQTVAQRRQLAAQRGITPEMFNKFSLGKVPDQAFNDFIAGQRGGDIEFFLKDGEVKPYRTDEGMVWDKANNRWVTAQQLGLQRAPEEVQKIEQVSETMADRLIEEGVKGLADARDAANKAVDSIESIDESLLLLDEPMFTGYGAEFRRDLARLGSLVGLDLSQESKIANTETYQGAAGARVADYITNLGSGTGLSDKDREFAEKVVAGDISMSPAAMKRLLLIMRKQAVRKINGYMDLRTAVSEELEGKERALGLALYKTFPRYENVEYDENDMLGGDVDIQDVPAGETVEVDGVTYIVDGQ